MVKVVRVMDQAELPHEVASAVGGDDAATTVIDAASTIVVEESLALPFCSSTAARAVEVDWHEPKVSPMAQGMD